MCHSFGHYCYTFLGIVVRDLTEKEFSLKLNPFSSLEVALLSGLRH